MILWERRPWREVEECRGRVCFCRVEGPVVVAEPVDDEDGVALERADEGDQFFPDGAEEDVSVGEPFADCHGADAEVDLGERGVVFGA